jgi:DNA-binding NarL/FixJ family response regulator
MNLDCSPSEQSLILEQSVMYKTLIVEDHPGFRHSLNSMLSSNFPLMDIVEASSGKDALKRLDTFEPDLVFMDINLQDNNGINLTKSIKLDHAHTTVIVMTLHDFPEYRQAALNAGASHFIAKDSFSEERVLSLVKTVMAHEAK